MLKTILIAVASLLVGIIIGGSLATNVLGDQFKHNTNLIWHGRNLREMDRYISAITEEGSIEFEKRLVTDVYFHLLGVRLYTDKVSSRLNTKACMYLKKTLDNKEKILKFSARNPEKLPDLKDKFNWLSEFCKRKHSVGSKSEMDF